MKGRAQEFISVSFYEHHVTYFREEKITWYNHRVLSYLEFGPSFEIFQKGTFSLKRYARGQLKEQAIHSRCSDKTNVEYEWCGIREPAVNGNTVHQVPRVSNRWQHTTWHSNPRKRLCLMQIYFAFKRQIEFFIQTIYMENRIFIIESVLRKIKNTSLYSEHGTTMHNWSLTSSSSNTSFSSSGWTSLESNAAQISVLFFGGSAKGLTSIDWNKL